MAFYPPKQPDFNRKKNAQIAHAQRRAKERLETPVNTQDLARRIQSGDSVFLGRDSHRISHHSLLVNGKWVECVYDGKRKVVVTVWPAKEDKE